MRELTGVAFAPIGGEWNRLRPGKWIFQLFSHFGLRLWQTSLFEGNLCGCNCLWLRTHFDLSTACNGTLYEVAFKTLCLLKQVHIKNVIPLKAGTRDYNVVVPVDAKILFRVMLVASSVKYAGES